MCKNLFIDYLNSIHNANASNENAIAENQVTSIYYEKVIIKLDIGKKIIDYINSNKPTTIIITGHAGDGKTSLLIQILKDLGIFNLSFKLEKYNEVQFGNEKNLFYVKDMSEIDKDEQNNILKKCLENSKKGIWSILVSNTGPLLNTFKRISNKDTSLENIILNQLDKNEEEILNIKILEEFYSVKIINIARIDNTEYVKKIFENLFKEEFWKECKELCSVEKCPIFRNYDLISKNVEKISEFIYLFYKWQFENGERTTLRQIIAHLSFSITGNLSCNTINESNLSIFSYNFGNLFFGYKGLKEIFEAEQIKGIKELRDIELDQKKIEKDYNLFIQEDFTCFPPEIREEVKKEWGKNKNKRNNEAPNFYAYDQKVRRAIRRVYFFFNNETEEIQNLLYKEIYSEMFLDYLKFQNKLTYERKSIRNLNEIIFHALSRLFTGVSNNDSERIYLTLKRDGDYLQNVQIVKGEIKKEDITVKQALNEKTMKYDLTLEFRNHNTNITLPMLNYFYDISKGVIKTKIDPQLSNGIDRLKAKLLTIFSAKEADEKEIKLLLISSEKNEIVQMEINKDKIIVF